MNNAQQNRDCPPLMSDQRHATDYRPSCYVHHLMLSQNGIRNSEELRMFLQNNAQQLRELNLTHFKQSAGCNSCNYYHVDPNGNDKYWSDYKKWMNFDGQN